MYAQTTAHGQVPIYPESDGKPMAETDIHRNLLADLVFTLENHFREQSDVYVSGNLLVYYVEGNPAKCFAPDVFVVRGVPKGQRRIYKLWEEGVAPQVIIELTSRKTSREDLQTKWQLYQELGVPEYFIFDPEYDYLDEPLIAYRLEQGRYLEQPIKDHRVMSDALGLELVDTGKTLRLLDPTTSRFLPNSLEAATAQEQLQKAVQAEQEARQLAAELEATLARYREQFGDLPKEK
ncbi:MAG: Uma2 family endonuclease [Acidobacteria bacterium]|nr:Uma2 family endonuclease [Acidobacteriota bacterium]